MRKIKYIVVHCTGTVQSAKVESIVKYWHEVMHWSQVGYHYIIEANGNIVTLQSEDKVTNGVKGYNSESVHVCYIGGQYRDDRTAPQKSSLIRKLTELKKKYPTATIQGHRDFPGVTKKCPQFDAKTEYKWIS